MRAERRRPITGCLSADRICGTARGRESERFGDTTGLRKQADRHLLHGPGAVHLDRLLDGVQVRHNLLVEAANDDVRDHRAPTQVG